MFLQKMLSGSYLVLNVGCCVVQALCPACLPQVCPLHRRYTHCWPLHPRCIHQPDPGGLQVNLQGTLNPKLQYFSFKTGSTAPNRSKPSVFVWSLSWVMKVASALAPPIISRINYNITLQNLLQNLISVGLLDEAYWISLGWPKISIWG